MTHTLDSTPKAGLSGERRPTISQAFVQLTDLGLVDVDRFEIVPLWTEEPAPAG